MAFFKIEDRNLESLLEIANAKGTSLDNALQFVIDRGIEHVSAQSKNELNGTVHNPAQYVTDHWLDETDLQMALALNLTEMNIRALRYGAGLMRKRGAKLGPTSRRRNTLAHNFIGPHISAKQLRTCFLSWYIKQHTQEMDDASIGRLMNPPASRAAVYHRRLELGLKRTRGQVANASGRIADLVKPKEFTGMVIYGGYTMTDYIKEKGLRCSRERLRQVAEELNLKHAIVDRAPSWALVRLARKFGNSRLASRKWLAWNLKRVVSIREFAAEQKVPEHDLYIFIRTHRLTHPQLRKHGVETVRLTCTGCENTFDRFKRHVDKQKRIAAARGLKLEFFCSTNCTGKHNAVRSVERKELGQVQSRTEKSKARDAYITEHWKSKTDAEIAKELGITSGSIERRRLTLELKRD